MGRIIFIVIAAIVTVLCIWMVYLAQSAGDSSGAWLFAAFAFLFSAPATIVLINLIRTKGVDQPHLNAVRFVPHWQMMVMIGIALLAILIMILLSLRR